MSFRKNLARVALIGGLAAYAYTGTNAYRSTKGTEEPINLPATIQTIYGPLNTTDIDFEGKFDIKTDRYHVIKNEDWGLSRFVGFFGSLPAKLMFMDSDIGAGLDARRSKRVLQTLENHPEIRNLTVRINHNEALYDCERLFTDPAVIERNNFLARFVLGVPTALGDELLAELFRGDYYNPLTQTVVTYSNVEAIPFHEIGHHQDYQRFTSDWEYAAIGLFPPARLYKEWQASFTYGNKHLAPSEQYQTNRHLIPAYLTYLLGIGMWMKKKYKKYSGAGDRPTWKPSRNSPLPTLSRSRSAREVPLSVSGNRMRSR